MFQARVSLNNTWKTLDFKYENSECRLWGDTANIQTEHGYSSPRIKQNKNTKQKFIIIIMMMQNK